MGFRLGFQWGVSLWNPNGIPMVSRRCPERVLRSFLTFPREKQWVSLGVSIWGLNREFPKVHSIQTYHIIYNTYNVYILYNTYHRYTTYDTYTSYHLHTIHTLHTLHNM